MLSAKMVYCIKFANINYLSIEANIVDPEAV